MKTPPYLLGAAVAFWGWQSDFLVTGLILGVIVELPRFVPARWEFSDEDFNRLWTLCSVLALAAAVYAFTSNEGPAMFSRWFAHPNFNSEREAGTASARAGATLMRWMPLPFYLFALAQVFNTRETIPLTSISMLLRWRLERAKKRGESPPTVRAINVTYPYLILCLFGASARSGGGTFFWGLSALVGWALWPVRSRRSGLAIWGASIALAVGCGYCGQIGLIRTQKALESYTPQWLGFWLHRGADPTYSHTQIGSIGRSKQSTAIVLRIRTQNGAKPPYYFREAAYREYSYRMGEWMARSTNNQFVILDPEGDGSLWRLPPGKTNLQVNVACYLPGGSALLPLPNGTGKLDDLPVSKLETNRMSDVRATGPGLVIFDAQYGHGPAFGAPPDTNDLYIVEWEPNDLATLDKVIAELQLSKTASEAEKLHAVSQFFQDNFTYGEWSERRGRPRKLQDPLNDFLLANRRGNCEYFASATVLLLRRMGIPARYATGYAVHENTGVDRYVARGADAHAWCLVWRNEMWQDFDTTPASWVKEEEARISGMQHLYDWLSDLWFQFSKFRWSQTRVRQYLLWALAPLLVVVLYRVIFKGQVRRSAGEKNRRGSAQNRWPGLDSEFYNLEKALASRGFGRETGEALAAWMNRIGRHLPAAGIAETLREVVWLHYRHRFDPVGLSAPERMALRDKTVACVNAIGR